MKPPLSAVAWLPVAVLLALSLGPSAQSRLPVIDMHLHARRADYIGPNPPPMCVPFERMPRWDPSQPITTGLTFGDSPPCPHPIRAATTDDQVMRETLAVMERRNIIGMVSGEPGLIATWRAALADRMIAGLDLSLGGRSSAAHRKVHSVRQVRHLLTSGGFKVLGEVMAQYDGLAPDDSRLEPYWALAEELDVPVGIHLGPGGPGEEVSCDPESERQFNSAESPARARSPSPRGCATPSVSVPATRWPTRSTKESLAGFGGFQSKYLASDDARQGAAPVALVSPEFWRTRLGSGPQAGLCGDVHRVTNNPACVEVAAWLARSGNTGKGLLGV